MFPYEQDKTQKSIRSFTVTKLYDSDKNRWKTERDIDRERDMSFIDQKRIAETDMTVNFSFSTNQVKFNSGLNADVIDALKP